MVNFYHRFVPRAADLLRSIYRAIAAKEKLIQWTPELTEAFDAAKRVLADATMLAHPVPGAHIALVVDASVTSPSVRCWSSWWAALGSHSLSSVGSCAPLSGDTAHLTASCWRSILQRGISDTSSRAERSWRSRTTSHWWLQCRRCRIHGRLVSNVTWPTCPSSPRMYVTFLER